MPFLHGPSTPCYPQCIVNPNPTIIPSYLAIQAGCNHIPISFIIKVFTKTRQAPNERNAYPKPSQTNMQTMNTIQGSPPPGSCSPAT